MEEERTSLQTYLEFNRLIDPAHFDNAWSAPSLGSSIRLNTFRSCVPTDQPCVHFQSSVDSTSLSDPLDALRFDFDPARLHLFSRMEN